jgi:hypothetical protein
MLNDDLFRLEALFEEVLRYVFVVMGLTADEAMLGARGIFTEPHWAYDDTSNADNGAIS